MPTLLLSSDGGPAQSLDWQQLRALPEQIEDVGTLMPGRRGAGVRLRSALEAARLPLDQAYATLHSADGFAASVPLAPLLDGVIVYRDGEEALASEQGGPLRFLLAGIDSCGTGEVDRCANIKQLARIELSAVRGEDTRPRR